jgi:hypothetical protein
MRSLSMLILLAAFVIAAPTQAVESYKSRTGHFNGHCDDEWDASKFADKVCYVTKDYDPSSNYSSGYPVNNYSKPQCDPEHQVAQNQKDLLARAYSRAPFYVRARLCRLTQLYLTEAPEESYGFWVPEDLHSGGDVFIFLSDSSLNDSLADGENKILHHLYGAAAGLPSFETPPGWPFWNSPEWNVLAVLAHELGHVLLADTNADGTAARRYRPRQWRPSPPPQSTCFEHDFLQNPWNRDVFHNHMRRWVKFGDQNNNLPNPPKSSEIENLYNSGKFVSVFAAWSPEEDFVETFKIRALRDALAALWVKFPSGNNVNALYHDSNSLGRKFECLHQLKLW